MHHHWSGEAARERRGPVNSNVGHRERPMKTASLLVSLTLLAGMSLAQQKNNQNSVPAISYCDLFRQTDASANSEMVRIHATWNYGFEWTFLFDAACPNQRAWVEFVPEEKRCGAFAKNLKKLGHKDVNKPASVTMVGKLREGGGNSGGYKYTFVVTCIESFKTISNWKPDP